MAIKVKKQNSELVHVLAGQEEDEVKTSVKFKPLNIQQLAKIEGEQTSYNFTNQTVQIKSSEVAVKAFKIAVTDIENLFDEEDQKVPFKKDADGSVSEELMAMLGLNTVVEVGTIILQASRFPQEAESFLGK